jgi:hypothetical protein
MKKQVKKLVLAKETLWDMSNRELTAIRGGSTLVDTYYKWCRPDPADDQT